jgi:hypothetical protein
MTAPPDLGPWLRQQREQRSWTRNELARRLIRAVQVSGDTAMPAACDIAASTTPEGLRRHAVMPLAVCVCLGNT